MHKQEFNGESPVTGLKGMGGQVVQPFLETPGLKCRLRWPYMLVTPVCSFGNSLVATLRLISQNKCHFHHQSHPIHPVSSLIVASQNKQKNLRSRKVSNTGLKSSIRAIEWYAYCLGYLYFTPRYGFPKSNGTVPVFYNKIQWKGWHHVTSLTIKYIQYLIQF